MAAGKALLTTSNSATFGDGLFWRFVISNVSGLLMSLRMLKSWVFGRTTSIIGIVANVLGLGYFFTLIFCPSFNFIPVSAFAPFLLVWYILIGIRLLKLARNAT